MKQRLSLDALRPDMRLAEDLRRDDGILLLPRGTILTLRHVALLPSWRVLDGVAWVALSSQDEPDQMTENLAQPPEDTPLDLSAAAKALAPRFARTDLEETGQAALFSVALPRAAGLLACRGPHCLDLPGPVDPETLPPAPDTPAPGPMAIIESDPKLTSLPDVFVRISDVLHDPNSTAKEAADAIGKDVSLSAKLLQLVNSAFYGFPVKVDTLSRAVTIVGSRQLTTLALGISVIGIFKDLPERLVEMRSFWKHSIGCGIIASNLVPATADNGADLEVERLFVAGLLHDVGRLVLYRNLPRHAAHVLAKARNEGIALRDAERAMLGFDHATLGGMLLRRWRFPENLERAVRHHHGGATPMGQLMPAMIHVADAATNALLLGSSGEVYVPPLSPPAWVTLGLTQERLGKAVAAADIQATELINVFLPDEA
ncbi:HDOD domain-containing protein [Desulfovibrio sp. TomC]|uniref:HDOD domain-containing protein n=1 Tax=Desulfovibrio sp. TomC TaxID=1562888 RepID=UPI000575641D|nr:HDOD domain-containing protein [Desulfovibrio sp. TomC]KHK01406.1 putative signal transduction protein [Desulfovibrio sp. TomC]